MSRTIGKLILLALILAFAGFPATRSAAGETRTSPAPKDLETLWSDLLAGEPIATRAILALAKTPDDTTVFLAGRIKPLTLSEERLNSLIEQLGSKDEKQWKAAFHELEYFDPRLAMNLEQIMGLKSVQEYPVRHRMVDILSDRSGDEPYSATVSKHKFIKLESLGNGAFNFWSSDTMDRGSGGSWWAEGKVEQLNVLSWGTKKREWARIVRALALLESIGSTDSMAVIEAIATGHPDAQPTKVANDMLARLTKR